MKKTRSLAKIGAGLGVQDMKEDDVVNKIKPAAS